MIGAALGALRAPFTAGAWLATGQVLLGGVLGVVGLGLTVGLVVLGVVLAWTVVVPVLALGALLLLAHASAVVHRSRLAAFQGIDPGAGRKFRPASWRQVGYHLLAGPAGLLGVVVVGGAWAAGLLLGSAFLHGWALPERGPFGWNLRSPFTLTAMTLLGCVLLLAAPVIARTAARTEMALARALLGPSRRELTERLTGLARSRAATLEAADAERRRIERDLHDGAQQRLVTLAMNLGIARATLKDLPEPARAAIERAHDDAKLAMTELRDFVRGLHPAVLDERGLRPALSGLAARLPIPVKLTVEMAERPVAATEAVAYFVASEALTNVVKHAGAGRIELTVRRDGDVLTLTVLDDGVGGADPGGGSGLVGLAHRVASVEGTLTLTSPAGGPTRLTVELPCVL